MRILLVFVVIAGVAFSQAKQEKSNTKFSFNDPFPGESAKFDFSSFAFNPFTPFPELTPSTSRPLTTPPTAHHNTISPHTTPKLNPFAEALRQLYPTRRPIPITRGTATTTAQPSITKLRERPRSNTDTLEYRQGLDFTDGSVSRREDVDQDGTLHGSYTYKDSHGDLVVVRYIAGKNGYKVISDSNKEEIEVKGAPLVTTRYVSTADWVASIWERTTSRPRTTTTTPTTTTTRPPTTLSTTQTAFQYIKFVQPRQQNFQPRQQQFVQARKQKLFASQQVSRPTNFPEQGRSQQGFSPQQQTQLSQLGQRLFQRNQQITPHQQFTAQQQTFNIKQQQIAPQQRLSHQQYFATQQPNVHQQNGFFQDQQRNRELEQIVLNQQQNHQNFLTKNAFRLSVQQQSQPRQQQFGQQQQFRQQHQFQQQQSVHQPAFNQQSTYQSNF